MKQLTEETQKSLEAIRDKVTNKGKHPATSYSPQEVLHLQEVNREILSWSNIRQNTINQSCTSCIQEAINIAYNYVTYHEVRPDNRKAKVIEVTTGNPNSLGERMKREHGYDVSGLEDVPIETDTRSEEEQKPTSEEIAIPYKDINVSDSEALKLLPYKELMETAKKLGHTGKREKAEKLIAFIEGKMKG